MEFEDHVRRMPWTVGETPYDHTSLWPPVGEDPSNKKRAPKVRGGDKLMGEATKVKGVMAKWMRLDEQAKAWAVIHGVIMSFVSIFFFIVMLTMWFRVYHNSFGWSVAILLLCLVASAGIAWWGSKRGPQRRWIVFLGCLCALMTFVGLIFGFFMYFKFLVYYQKYLELRTYSNVGGSQGATGFNDASMFLFTQDTRLDVMRSVGYKSRWTGKTYCVAPVVDSTMTNANPINFWAVGEGCCLARGEYMCDDAHDPKTMSALVVLEPEDVVRPFMRWAVSGSVYPRYERSIKLQEASYAVRAAKRIKMLYWVKDPIAKQNSFYNEAKINAILSTVILWFCLLFFSVVFCYIYRPIPTRHDKRLADPTQATPLKGTASNA